MSRYAPSMLSVARWWMSVLGGMLIGAGLVLHGQVAVARFIREEVENTFVLWRGIGNLTFMFQGDQTQMALWLFDIPVRVITESNRAAWTLVAVGLIFSFTSFAFRSPTPATRRT